MDVNKLLDNLEEYVENGKLPVVGRLRFFGKAFFLDIEEVLSCTAQIRVSLPQQIQKADQITREKERILAEAHEQAEHMVSEAAEQAELAIRKAQDEARILVSSHEVTLQAQLEGQRIAEQAKQEAEAIRQGALEYARDIIENLNQAIANVSGHVSQLQVVAQQARDEIKM